MSWLSEATGIHWGDVSKPIVTGLGALLAVPTGGLSTLGAAAYDAGPGARGARGARGAGGDAQPSGSGLDTLLGAAGGIQSAADAQRQGALLRDALAAYNQNWTQGKGIRLAPHPVDLSQTFADPTNPFYSPSAGAVATTGANGQPLPGVPNLQIGGQNVPIPGDNSIQGRFPNGYPGNAVARPGGGGPLPGVPPLSLGGPSAGVPIRPGMMPRQPL